MPLDLEAIRQRCEAATGPRWFRTEPKQGSLEAAPGVSIFSETHTEPLARISGYLLPVEANAEFIIHARTDLPALCAELTATRAEVERLKTERNWLRGRVAQAGRYWTRF
jgi:hypothetical protein